MRTFPLRSLTDTFRAKWRWRTAGLRLLPDFVILGAMRSGTTSLYELLAQHPRILPATRKEVHFFSSHYANGPRWYRTHFPLAAEARLRALRAGGPVLTGEATPYYLFHPHAPRRLHAVLPHARLIALLRDPVDRAYSLYRLNLVTGMETLSFDAALDREDERLREETQLLRDVEYYRSRSHRLYSYVARGRYLSQLAAYHHYFPRDQLLVLRSEDYFADARGTLARVLEFLGLGPDVPDAIRFPAPLRRPAVPAPAAERLRRLFAPHNERLYRYLGVDFGWGRREVRAAA
jgi:hypothetical protein